MRAAIYIRVSSVMQLDNFSLDAQQAACRKLAGERGWQVTCFYADEAQSAKTTERPKFREMMQDARAKRFDIIIVHKLDRFSRSVIDLLTLLHNLKEMDIALVSATEQFDFTTPMGRVMLTMLAAFAQWYLDNLSAETTKGKQARAEAGLWNSDIPFGYNVRYKKDGGDGIPRPDEHDAQGVRLALEQYATGMYSDNDIARLLNEAGYRPHGRGRRALPLFGKDALTELLQNRFYLGEVQYKGQWYPGVHEPLVSQDVFDRCQAVREKRRVKVGTSARDASREYLLTGIAKCARCGGHMRGDYSMTNQKRYYRDPARQRGQECDQRMVGADGAENAVGNWLRQIVLPDDWRERVVKIVQEQTGNVRDVMQERARTEAQLERARYLFKLGDISEQEYLADRNRLQVQLAGLTPQVRSDLEQAGKLLHNFETVWDAATPQERRQMIQTLLQAVYLDCERGPVVSIEPKPEYKALFEMGKEAK